MTNLQLRPIEAEDLSFLRDLANEPAVRSKVVGWDWPVSLGSQQRWFGSGPDNDKTRRFIVESSGGPVGLTGLWDIDMRNRTAITGLKLGGVEDVRGHGLGTLAVQALMRFAFDDVGLNRLHSTILATNEASIALYTRKCGWKIEGLLRQHVWRDGGFVDVIQIGMLRADFLLMEHKAE